MKRIYALEYFELAFYLGGVLLLEHTGGHIVPKSPYMTTLVNAVIGDYFSLYSSTTVNRTLGKPDTTDIRT